MASLYSQNSFRSLARKMGSPKTPSPSSAKSFFRAASSHLWSNPAPTKIYIINQKPTSLNLFLVPSTEAFTPPSLTYPMFIFLISNSKLYPTYKSHTATFYQSHFLPTRPAVPQSCHSSQLAAAILLDSS